MENGSFLRNFLFAIVIGASSGVTRIYSCDNPELEKRIEALEKLHAERD